MSLQVFGGKHHFVAALYFSALIVFLNLGLPAKHSHDSLIRSEIVKSLLLQAGRRVAFVDKQTILWMYVRDLDRRLALLNRYLSIREIRRNHLHCAATAHSQKYA